MEDTACSGSASSYRQQLPPITPSTSSSANCHAAAICGITSADHEGAAELLGVVQELQGGGPTLTSPSSASCTSTSCPRACSSCSCCACCGCRSTTYSASQQQQPAADRQLKEIDSIFSAAEAALQAFWRSSIARATLSSSSADQNGLPAYRQVRVAARSQAAACIAWVLAAASVVLKDQDDLDGDDDVYQDDADQLFSSNGPDLGFSYNNYPHRRTAEYCGGRNMVRRADEQLSSMRASLYNGHNHIMHGTTTRSIPRWEWRPVMRPSRSTPRPPSTAGPASHAVPMYNSSTSCTPTVSYVPHAAPAPPQAHPLHPHNIKNGGAPSISLTSLLPPLISCRITDRPYNEETLDRSLAAAATRINASTILASTAIRLERPIRKHVEPSNCKDDVEEPLKDQQQAWCTPPASEKSIAIDIIDQQSMQSTSLVEPYNLMSNVNIMEVEEEEEDDNQEKSSTDVLLLDQYLPQTQTELEHAGPSKETSHGGITANIFNADGTGSKHDINELTNSQGGRNYKKHLKKKQRKAAASPPV